MYKITLFFKSTFSKMKTGFFCYPFPLFQCNPKTFPCIDGKKFLPLWWSVLIQFFKFHPFLSLFLLQYFLALSLFYHSKDARSVVCEKKNRSWSVTWIFRPQNIDGFSFILRLPWDDVQPNFHKFPANYPSPLLPLLGIFFSFLCHRSYFPQF